MVILMKGVKPNKLKVDAIRLEMLNELRKAGREIRKDFEKTTKTWEGKKPKFEMLISLKGGPTLLVFPDGGKGADKWRWLDQGTRVRYATMSPDFRAKTQVRVLGSRPGRGKRLFISKKHPRPGIKARGWSDLITKKHKRPLKKRMEAAMGRGAKKSGHSLR